MLRQSFLLTSRILHRINPALYSYFYRGDSRSTFRAHLSSAANTKWGDYQGDPNDELSWRPKLVATKFANELRSLTPKELGERVQLLHLQNPLDVYDLDERPFLITRQDSRQLYDEVLDRMHVPRVEQLEVQQQKMKDAKLVKPLKRAMVIGNPGIGKSFGLFYALQRLLRANKLVFYHHLKQNDLYAFVPDPLVSTATSKGQYVAYRADVSADDVGKVPRLRDPESFYLFDPDENVSPKLVQAHAIIASSPDQEKLKDYVKAGAKPFYMPMWKLKELQALRKSDLGLIKLSNASMDERFSRIGGSLREYVEEDSFQALCGQQEDKIGVASSEEVIRRSLREHANFELNARTVDPGKSSTLFAYDAKKPYTRNEMVVRVVSQYVLQQIVLRYYDSAYNVAMKDVKTWETFCSTVLNCGGTFEVRRLFQDPDEVIQQDFQKCRGYPQLFARLKQQWAKLPFSSHPGSPSPVMYLSTNPTFPLVDAVSLRDQAFQFTISEEPKRELPSAQTVAALLDELVITEEQPLHIYYCVPQANFDNWSKKKVPFKFPDDDAKTRAGARVRQYVLKIPAIRPAPDQKYAQARQAALATPSG